MCVCVSVCRIAIFRYNRAKFFRPSINFPTVTLVALVPRWQQVPRANVTDWVDAGWFPNWLWWGLFWVVAYEKLVPEAKVDAPPSCHSLILGTPHRRRNSPYGTGTHDDDDAAGFFSLFPAPLTEWQHGMGGGDEWKLPRDGLWLQFDGFVTWERITNLWTHRPTDPWRNTPRSTVWWKFSSCYGRSTLRQLWVGNCFRNKVFIMLLKIGASFDGVFLMFCKWINFTLSLV